MPARTLPEEQLNLVVAHFLIWLENLLGVKDNTENEKRIKFLFERIKEKAWGLSIDQLMEAFKMYVDGMLPIEPMSGFIDTIQFNKVVSAYKDAKAPQMDLKQISYSINDHFIQHNTLAKDGKPISGVCETFDYLYKNGVLPSRTGASEKVIEAYEKMMISAGGYLIAPLIDERKELQEDGLQKTPRFKEIQMEIQKIRKQEHPALKPKFKQLVLESFFKKQKRHLRDIL